METTRERANYRGRAGTLAILALVAATVISLSPGMADTSEIEGVVSELRTACDLSPATRCTRTVHAFFDRNGDGSVSPTEITAVREAATDAANARESALSAEERSMIGLALLALQSAGPDKVFARFDANGDGGIGHEEMFADFSLDERPFAAVVEDRHAVDWNGFANRFGKLGKTLVSMLPQAAAR